MKRTRTKTADTAALAKKKKRPSRAHNALNYDWTLVFMVLFLIGLGLVLLYSASYYNASVKFGNPMFYVKKQAFYSMLGLCSMAALAHLDYHKYYHAAGILYLLSLGVNILVLFAGSTYSGSTRWLSIGGFSVQPSETAKIAVVILTAHMVCRISKKMGSFKAVATIFATMLPIIAVVAVNNLSTGIILMGITAMMLFVSSPKYMQFVGMFAGLVAVASVFLIIAPYRVTRIQIWLHPENYDKGYQTLQGLYAIGSGGIFGKGFGQSLQKLGYVPELENDMIFSIICEELGLIGAICVLLLFVLLIWRFMLIANNADDMFGSLLVVGFMCHIALQVILNIAVVTNSIPNTGVSLPFISYGGSSVFFLLSELGIVLNVSHGIRLESLEEKDVASGGKKSRKRRVRSRNA